MFDCPVLTNNNEQRVLHPQNLRPSCRPYSFEAEANHRVQRTQVGIRDGCCLLVSLVLWDQGTHDPFPPGARATTDERVHQLRAFIEEYDSEGSLVQTGSAVGRCCDHIPAAMIRVRDAKPGSVGRMWRPAER